METVQEGNKYYKRRKSIVYIIFGILYLVSPSAYASQTYCLRLNANQCREGVNLNWGLPLDHGHILIDGKFNCKKGYLNSPLFSGVIFGNSFTFQIDNVLIPNKRMKWIVIKYDSDKISIEMYGKNDMPFCRISNYLQSDHRNENPFIEEDYHSVPGRRIYNLIYFSDGVEVVVPVKKKPGERLLRQKYFKTE